MRRKEAILKCKQELTEYFSQFGEVKQATIQVATGQCLITIPMDCLFGLLYGSFRGWSIYMLHFTQARIANHPYALIAFKDAATARKVVESTEAGEMNTKNPMYRLVMSCSGLTLVLRW